MIGRKEREGQGSLFAPVDLTKVGNKPRARAEKIYAFLKRVGSSTRAQMRQQLEWATKGNTRLALRILITEKRVAVDTSSTWVFHVVNSEVAWSNRMLNEGKIEHRRCKGKTLTGRPCKVPDLYVRDDGYCMHHGPDGRRAGHSSWSKNPMMTAQTVNDENIPSVKPPVVSIIHPIVEEPQHVPVATHTSFYNPKTGWLTVKVEIPQSDDPLIPLVRAFIAGNATINDLREAVE